MTAILSVDSLGWDAGDKTILDDISFEIETGAFVGLIGANGAGKSSLLRCLYRVNRPTRGSVSIFEQNIWQHSARDNAKKVAVILQEHSDHLGLRVRDVVALGLTPHKKLFSLDTDSDLGKIQRAIAQVDLSDFSHEPYAHLSGGEKQRVMVARAIVQDPQLLLMDEPTNHWDIRYQIDVLQQVKNMGVTVLSSFHDLNLAAAYCDTIIALDKGRLVAVGSPAEVLTEDRIAAMFNTRAMIDEHPLHGSPRISYAYHRSAATDEVGGDHE